MKIYVINLKESTARRAWIAGQLSSLGLDFEFVDAVNGIQLSASEKSERFSEVRFRRKYGRTATNGEIGCALSHVQVYQKVTRSGLPFALVLEDDAWLSPDLVQILASVEATYRPTDNTIVLLSPVSALRGSTFRRMACGYVACPVGRAMLSHAYVVTAASAASLLARQTPVTEVADAWTWLRRERVIDVEAVFPAVAIVRQAEGSAIRMTDPQPPKPRALIDTGRFRALWWRHWYLAGSTLSRWLRRPNSKQAALLQ